MENAERELESRGIKITQGKWLSTDFSGHEDASPRSVEGNAVAKKPAMSGKAKTFVAAFAALVFVVPILLTNLPGGDDALVSMLRCFVMLIAALMIWSRNRIFVIFGSAVSGLFAIGSLTSLVGGSGWVVSLLLNKLVRIPGIYVFHGLKSPGAKKIDVEHAVTHGNNVYLIDSWLDWSTNYSWHPNRKGLAASSKGDDGHRHTKIADAADRYRAVLGHGVNVIPVIAVASGTASIGPERWSPRGVGLFTADEVLRFIGDGAVESLPTFRDRPEVRETVASTVESYA